MLSVIRLNVVILIVAAPLKETFFKSAFSIKIPIKLQVQFSQMRSCLDLCYKTFLLYSFNLQCNKFVKGHISPMSNCDELMTCHWSKCRLESEQRENVNRENDLINNILIVVLINIICPSQMFLSNSLFYCWHHLPLSAMLCLSRTISLCLFAVLLYSQSVPLDIKPLAIISSSSLFTIKLFDTHRCFT